jgi:hypothetical protein
VGRLLLHELGSHRWTDYLDRSGIRKTPSSACSALSGKASVGYLDCSDHKTGLIPCHMQFLFSASMKVILLTLIASFTLAGAGVPAGYAQGTFLFYNGSAPTRLGSIDGPFAGYGIWAQMLVGRTAEDLQPIFIALEHSPDGVVGGVVRVTVDGIGCLETAYIQMVAWDGVYWGTTLENVPLDQLGRTDIVPHPLGGCKLLPVFAPDFTQPAIVPPIPEPSMASIYLVGTALAFAAYLGRSCRQRGGR